MAILQWQLESGTQKEPLPQRAYSPIVLQSDLEEQGGAQRTTHECISCVPVALSLS
jgi:hypothetical protein